MNRSIEKLTKEVISLPKSDRLKLVKALLLLDNQVTDENVEEIWQEEITKRVKSVENGEAVGVDLYE